MNAIRGIDDLSFWHKALLLILLPLAFDLGFLVIIAASTQESDRLMKEILIARENIANADALQKSLYKAISFYMNSVYASKKDFYTRYVKRSFEESKKSAELLKKRNASSDLESLYGELLATADNISTTLEEYIRNRQGLGGIVSSAQFLKEEPEKLTRMTIKLNRIQEDLANRAMTKHELLNHRISTYLNLGLLLNGSLVMFLFLLFSRSTSRRLSILLSKLESFPSPEIMARSIAGNDEVGKLDQTFRKMSADLLQLRRRETAILDNSLAMLCRLDESGNLCQLSPATEKLLHYKVDDLKGKNFSLITELESEESFLEKLSTVKLSPDSEALFEWRLRRKDASLLDCSCGIRWSSCEGAYFCIITDTSSRALMEEQIRTNEERARFIIEHMPVGLVITDGSGQVREVNERLLSLLHVKREKIEARSLYDFFTHESGNDLDEMLRKATPEKYTRARMQIRREDGSPVSAELSTRRLEANEILVVVKDISARLNIERARRQFREIISERVESKIAAVTNCISKLSQAEAVFNEQGKKYLDKILTALGRTETLLREMRSLETLGKDGPSIDKTTSKASRILTKAFLAVEAYAQDKNINLELVQSDDANLFCDEEQIIRVLVNFLSNAVKFSNSGHRVILAGKKHADSFEFSVQDFGRGIPEDKLKSIFAKFEQVEDSDRSEKGGAGLGLAICQSIVEAHGSEIKVESEAGKGALFAFQIVIHED